MERKAISTERAPAAIGAYSQAICAGGFVFCSGQIPLDPDSGELVGDDVAVQTRRVMDNLGAVLDASGCGYENVVKVNLYLVDMGDFAKANEVYGSYFPHDAPPARAAFQVAGLPKGARVEAELVALI